MKIRRRLFIIIVAVIVVLSTGAVYANVNTLQKESKKDEKIYDPTVSSMQKLPFYDSKINNNNIAKYRFNYSLDINLKGDSSSTNSVLTAAAMNGISNALLQAQRSVIEIMIFMCCKAFDFKSYDIFKYSMISIIQKNFTNKYYIALALILIITGLAYFIKYIKTINSKIKFLVIRILIGVLILILLFIWPISLLSKADSVINGVSDGIFEAIMGYSYVSQEVEFDENGNDRIKSNENQNMIKLSSSLWNHYIHTPWRLMEFGNEELADKAQYKILQYSPNDPKRLEIIKQIEAGSGEYKDFKGYKSQEMPEKRLGFMLMYFVPIIINFLVIAAICLLLIGFHFIILFLVLIGVLVFVISIGKKTNTKLLKDWLYKVFGTCLTKLIISVILIFVLSVNNILFLYTSKSQMGWVFGLVVQIGLYVIIYWTRLSFIDFIKDRIDVNSSVLLMNLLGRSTKKVAKIADSSVLEKGINLKYLLGGEAPNKLPEGKSKKNLVENNKIDQVLLDISYGPYLKRDGEMIPTYMILVVNTSTSEIITGEFYLNKSIDTVLLAFEESIERFGVPKVLLIENEKIYNSKTFNKLSKQEKFEVIKFDSNQKEYGVDEVVRRIRNVFLKGLNINRLKGLDQLNLGFKKWIIESQKVNSYSGRWNS